MNPIPQAPSQNELMNESPHSPSDSVVTGKRQRKKNPKYETEHGESLLQINEPAESPKKIGRPRKKRKLNVTDANNPELTSWYKQKEDYETRASTLREELLAVKKELEHVQITLGLSKTEMDKIYAETEAESQYDAPTDDEDDTMDLDAPQFTPVVASPLPVIQQPTKPSPASNGQSRARGRGRTRGGRKKGTKRGTPKRKATAVPPAIVSRPKRTVKTTDPDLAPEFINCRDLLDQLMNHNYGFPFNEPVDPVLLGIPEYPRIIKHPMDFGTIRTKLNTTQYSDISEFIADVNLVFSNACTFNQPTSDVFIMAKALQTLFKEKSKVLEKQKQVLAPVPTHSTSVTVPHLIPQTESDNGAYRELKNSVDTMCSEIRDLLCKQTPGAASSSSNGTHKETPKQQEIPLTKGEKRRLSVNINSLSSSRLAVVVRIIKEKLPNIANDKEIVLDIESLDTPTLRSLQSYVNSTKRKKTKRTQRKKTTALQADPRARLELAKLTEIGTQSKIESVQRQLEELRSSSGLQTSTSRLNTSTSSVLKQESKADITSKSPVTTATPVAQLIAPTTEISQDDSGSDDSESGSEDSESGSEESESETEIPSLSSAVKNTVETVAAPSLRTSTPADLVPVEDAPRIIATPITSEVNVDKIENVASWNSLVSAKEEDKESAPVAHSADVTNLWSSFRDSHAQVQQKELEKKMREEQIQREKEEEEERRRKHEEEQKRLRLEEEIRKKQEEEEQRLKAEQELEEARQKAKRDREKKVLDDEPGDLLSFNSFDIPQFDMNISGQLVSDIRSSLKSTNTNSQDTTEPVNPPQ